MRKISVFLCIMFFSLCTSPARGQTNDLDTDSQEAPEGKPVSEIKYIAGKDGKWFTADDEVYHYYRPSYDANGNMVKMTRLFPGADKRPFTGDDQVEESHASEYNGPRATGEWLFDGEGTPKYHTIYEYNDRGRTVRQSQFDTKGVMIKHIDFTHDADGRVLKDIEYKGPGPDKQWLTADDEIEKYHVREYASGRLVRAKEFHCDKKGAGPDGKWFTPDDVVSSARQFVYGDNNKVAKTLKSISAGADGVWCTPDDELQYYTVRSYSSGTGKK